MVSRNAEIEDVNKIKLQGSESVMFLNRKTVSMQKWIQSKSKQKDPPHQELKIVDNTKNASFSKLLSRLKDDQTTQLQGLIFGSSQKIISFQACFRALD